MPAYIGILNYVKVQSERNLPIQDYSVSALDHGDTLYFDTADANGVIHGIYVFNDQSYSVLIEDRDSGENFGELYSKTEDLTESDTTYAI